MSPVLNGSSALHHFERGNAVKIGCLQSLQKEDAIPEPNPGVESKLGNWKSPVDMDAELITKFPGCMEGMYEQSTNHISLKDVM